MVYIYDPMGCLQFAPILDGAGSPESMAIAGIRIKQTLSCIEPALVGLYGLVVVALVSVMAAHEKNPHCRKLKI